MKTFVRRAVIVAAVLVALVAMLGVTLYVAAGSRVGRTFDIPAAVVTVDFTRDSAAVERGRHLAESITLCTGCHGEDLAGDALIDEPMIAVVWASNLTAGRGGVGADYSDADLVRAIRHGVAQDGRGLMIMHSDRYNRLGGDDLAALVAYLRSVPPVDNLTPGRSFGAAGRIMLALGLVDSETMPLVPAEVIDHDLPIPSRPETAVTAEYGGYLVSVALCAMCHGETFHGGPPIEEGAPPAPDISVYGMDGGWSSEQFISTIRTGVTPYGKELDGDVMPWEVYSGMTDDELAAIRLYLGSFAAGG